MVRVTDQLIIEKDNGVGRIMLNNQERRNAMTFEMWRDLPTILDDYQADDEIRAVVISGKGRKAFCAGADISQFEKTALARKQLSPTTKPSPRPPSI